MLLERVREVARTRHARAGGLTLPQCSKRISANQRGDHVRPAQVLRDFARFENRIQVRRVERLVEPCFDGGNIRCHNALADAG